MTPRTAATLTAYAVALTTVPTTIVLSPYHPIAAYVLAIAGAALAVLTIAAQADEAWTRMIDARAAQATPAPRIATTHAPRIRTTDTARIAYQATPQPAPAPRAYAFDARATADAIRLITECRGQCAHIHEAWTMLRHATDRMDREMSAHLRAQ